jgi:hypothetical protein
MAPPENKKSPRTAESKDLLAQRVCVATSLCLLLFAFSSPVLGQERILDGPLIASGTSPLMEEDSADARKLALDEALRAAVEQAVGRLLPAEHIVRYYLMLLNRILKEPMSYVRDYQIVHEGVIYGRYRVTVQTTLYGEKLSRDLRRLGLFLSAAERPRAAILVAERLSPEDPWHWWWQLPPANTKQPLFLNDLAKLLTDQGLVLLYPNMVLESLPADLIYQTPLLDDTQGVALARALGAEVVVLGRVSYRPTGMGSGGMANGSLRAVRTDSGELLARVSATVQVQPTTDHSVADYGFSALAERLAPHLVDGVMASFVAVSRGPREVTVQVEGVRSYGDLILIKEHLQHSAEVKQIRQIKLKQDQGSFSLVLAGSLDELQNSLEGCDFGAFVTSATLTAEDFLIVTILSKR